MKKENDEHLSDFDFDKSKEIDKRIGITKRAFLSSTAKVMPLLFATKLNSIAINCPPGEYYTDTHEDRIVPHYDEHTDIQSHNDFDSGHLDHGSYVDWNDPVLGHGDDSGPHWDSPNIHTDYYSHTDWHGDLTNFHKDHHADGCSFAIHS